MSKRNILPVLHRRYHYPNGDIRSLIHLNKGVRKYCFEQDVTGGLGFFDNDFNPKKGEGDNTEWRYEGRIKHYSDTEEGLQEHLRAMNDRAVFRDHYLDNILEACTFDAVMKVEDRAEEVFEVYEFIIGRCLEKMENLLGLDLGIIGEGIDKKVFPAVRDNIPLVPDRGFL
ncbi:MAG: hypothetical protein ACOCUT_04450 [bacterium]